MNKRIISLCLALALLLCLLPAAPTAAAAGDVAINETNFPDDIFRSYVSEDLDQNGDGVLSPTEISNVTEIECSQRGIASLNGIEYFTALTELSCPDNSLTALDVSKNTSLEQLSCDNNQLTALDVSKNPSLERLSCDNNQLTSLDVSKNTALKLLSCSFNQLTSLNVSKNTALEWLFCDNNQLSALDVSKNTALKVLWCDNNQLSALDVSKNTALKELYCYYNQLTSLDVSRNTALNGLSCDINQLTSLDVSKNTALYVLSCDYNQLTALDVSKNTSLERLSCDYNQLKSLDVSKNTALEWLSCDNNQLKSLDVSKNTALEWLFCFDNSLTALDVSRNTALKELNCRDNQLTTLDVGKNNTALETLWCENNKLTSLDVSKNAALEYLSCYGNKLTVLDVSAVPNLLDALENGEKTVNKAEGFVEYESEQGHIWMDLGQKTIPVTNCFSDVGSDDFFYDAVLWAYQNDITAGTSKTKFSPYKTCTREQVVTFLWRAMGCQEPTGTNNPFKDVPADAYYTKAVLWAVENGITNGKSRTKFGVGDPCTRGQVVTFLWRAEGEPEPTSAANPFKDVSETDYFYKAVLWAVENGITKGTSKTKFSPAKTCTRGQVVTFLYRDVVGE